jgi:hypothetical protein
MVALAFLALGVLAFWLAEPWSLYLMPQAGLAALAAAALSAVLRLWPAAGGFALAGAVALAPVAPLYLPRGDAGAARLSSLHRQLQHGGDARAVHADRLHLS